MELFTLAMVIAFIAYTVKSRDQIRRIALLGSHLQRFQIETLMENLTQGYLRALGESDPERKAQVWSMLTTAEVTLYEQINRFVLEFAKVDESEARVSKFPLAIPHADKLFPNATFDLRKALSIHARGITNAVNNQRNQSSRDKAFTVSAELFLLQHTCHWFCRSKTVASARMLSGHQTSYAQLIESVAPETRQAYCLLTSS